jgi:hypothetical protein
MIRIVKLSAIKKDLVEFVIKPVIPKKTHGQRHKDPGQPHRQIRNRRTPTEIPALRQKDNRGHLRGYGIMGGLLQRQRIPRKWTGLPHMRPDMWQRTWLRQDLRIKARYSCICHRSGEPVSVRSILRTAGCPMKSCGHSSSKAFRPSPQIKYKES